MRHPIFLTLCVTGAIALSACDKKSTQDVDRAFQDVNVIDESNLNDVMLTSADPNEGVSYFQRATAANPDRIDLQRGLGKSLVRANRNTEAVSAWKKVVAHEKATDDDRVDLADALIRNNDWDEADTLLDAIPPTYETFKRYRLEAMIADSNEEWEKADSFYEIAVGLTTRPAGVLNNWGYSKLTRGDYRDAEKLFGEAISYDTSLFTAKNNLVLARGAQRNYQLPIIDTSQVEKAQLLYTMALSAIKQGDVAIGEGLLEEAIAVHPQHFEAAVRSLRALQSNVAR